MEKVSKLTYFLRCEFRRGGAGEAELGSWVCRSIKGRVLCPAGHLVLAAEFAGMMLQAVAGCEGQVGWGWGAREYSMRMRRALMVLTLCYHASHKGI